MSLMSDYQSGIPDMQKEALSIARTTSPFAFLHKYIQNIVAILKTPDIMLLGEDFT